jgi:hypothetical protein
MNDFFGALELELREAATRRARPRIGAGQAVGALGGALLLAVAIGVALVVLGGDDGPGPAPAPGPAAVRPDPVGTVIPKGEGKPRRGARTLVVANGVAPWTGPWQLEVTRGKGFRHPETGEVLEPPGYCLWFNPLDPPGRHLLGLSGFCGAPRNLGFRKTPGFSRAQPGSTRSVKEVVVWGRVPERAAKVVVTAPGGTRIEVTPTDGPRTFPGRFYGIPVKPGLPGARINWLDEDGRPGSRGIRLMPPITR